MNGFDISTLMDTEAMYSLISSLFIEYLTKEVWNANWLDVTLPTGWKILTKKAITIYFLVYSLNLCSNAISYQLLTSLLWEVTF